MAEAELLKTFNAGIGMIVVVSAGQAERVVDTLQEAGERVHRIGHVAPGDGTVRYTGSLL